MSEGSVRGITSGFTYGRAFTDYVFPEDPAAGAGWSYTVSGAYFERILAITFTLTTSAIVASRNVTVDFKVPGTGRFYSAGPTVLQTAGSTQIYNAVRLFGGSDWNAGTPVYFGLPDFILPVAYEIELSIANIDAGDTVTDIGLLRERIQTGDGGYEVGYVVDDELAELVAFEG